MGKRRQKKRQAAQSADLKAISDELSSDLTKTDAQLFEHVGINQWSDPKSRKARIEKFGTNKRSVQKFHFVQEYLKTLFEPFNILLLIIGVGELLIYFLYHPKGVWDPLSLVSALVVFLMVILASVTDYVQEYLAFKNSTKLVSLITNDVYLVIEPFNDLSAINDSLLVNEVKKIHDTALTVGDLVYLTAGDLVPADMRLIWSDHLYLDQSSLTGETDPVEKSAAGNGASDIFKASNLLVSDTKVVRGKALGLVLAIGDETYANKIIGFSNTVNDQTDYEIGLRKVTKIILISILAFFPVVFVISGWRTGEWIGSLIFAISMVVSLIPESLPAILSSNIQVGSHRMAKQKMVVKNFKAIQNLGSTTVIGTDKTGTLTTGKLKLLMNLNAGQKADDEVLKAAYLSVYFQNNLANQIDEAISTAWKAEEHPTNFGNFRIVASKEFDFEARTTSILLSKDDQYCQITKGAPNEILGCLNLDEAEKKQIQKFVKRQEKHGLKVILVGEHWGDDHLVANDLNFLGYLIFENELKPGIKKVIKMFENYNLDLKVLTGDSPTVTQKLGEDLGLVNNLAITGDQYKDLSASQQLKAVEEYGIFAKLNPVQKAEVVTNLQENKEVVTYLGDGVNDVLALKQADVGISVNNGSPTAKVAADVILLQKDLGILETGIIEGRKIFTNAIKFIKIVVTLNFGLLITLLIGSIWFDFAAMSPIQLLLQNLLYDFMNLAFVFDSVDQSAIKKPRAWNPKSILSFGWYNGIVPVIISVTNFLIVGYGFGLFDQINIPLNSADDLLKARDAAILQFQTAFFMESLATHIMLVIVYRTEEWSIIQSRPSWTLAGVLLGFFAFGFFLVYTPKVNETLGFKPMEDSWWLMAYFGYSIPVYLLGEFSKWSYKKIFHQWI